MYVFTSEKNVIAVFNTIEIWGVVLKNINMVKDWYGHVMPLSIISPIIYSYIVVTLISEYELYFPYISAGVADGMWTSAQYVLCVKNS